MSFFKIHFEYQIHKELITKFIMEYRFPICGGRFTRVM